MTEYSQAPTHRGETTPREKLFGADRKIWEDAGNMNHPFLRSALLAVIASVFGCSSSDESGPTMIPVTTCAAALTPCGGDVVGTWNLTGACTEGALTEVLNRQLAEDYPSCADSFTSASMSSNGRVTYDGSNFSRAVRVQTTGKMKISAACVAEQIAGLALTSATCENLALVLPRMYEDTTFACTYDGTTCNCDMSSNQSVEESGTYSISGSTITESPGAASYTYCVAGSELSQGMRLTSNGIDGTARLTKQ